jgi:hypothetical protein
MGLRAVEISSEMPMGGGQQVSSGKAGFFNANVAIGGGVRSRRGCHYSSLQREQTSLTRTVRQWF